MGVSGCGKSSIGKRVSENLNIPFFDGDDYHPESNIAKMEKGIPLNDDDRQSWLETLNDLAKTQLESNSCVIACSALKQKYREIINQNIHDQVIWVFLSGSFDLIQKRLNHRKDHFMPSDLLRSQFEILEEPKDALQIEISASQQEIAAAIEAELLKISKTIPSRKSKN